MTWPAISEVLLVLGLGGPLPLVPSSSFHLAPPLGVLAVLHSDPAPPSWSSEGGPPVQLLLGLPDGQDRLVQHLQPPRLLPTPRARALAAYRRQEGAGRGEDRGVGA